MSTESKFVENPNAVYLQNIKQRHGVALTQNMDMTRMLSNSTYQYLTRTRGEHKGLNTHKTRLDKGHLLTMKQ